MKKTFTIVAALAAFSMSALAGETVMGKNPVAPAPEPEYYYNAHEWSVGLSALLAARTGTLGPNATFSNSTAWGADAEIKYFFTRNFGMGLEQQYLDIKGHPFWGSNLNFYLRAPLNESSRWAPYLFGGAGAVYSFGEARFEGFVGAGIECRFTQRIGWFLDGRHVWVNGANDVIPQFGLFRTGFNFVF